MYHLPAFNLFSPSSHTQWGGTLLWHCCLQHPPILVYTALMYTWAHEYFICPNTWRTHTHALTHTCMHAHKHTHAHAHTHTHTRTHAHSRTHAHAHVHMPHVHVCTCTHACTHTHTHSGSCSAKEPRSTVNPCSAVASNGGWKFTR